MNNEPYVAWQTSDGLIAIPESEATRRRLAMLDQLGIADLEARIAALEAAASENVASPTNTEHPTNKETP